MARAVAGLFADRPAAERAVEDLKGAGFDPAGIGVVMQDKTDTKEIAQEHGTHATEGAAAGGIIGGTAGALLAATGTLIIPGIGPFLSAGILATALVGGTAGWLVGGLTGLGIPHDEAAHYEDQVHQGKALVTVNAAGRDAEARQILLRDGAEDLQERGFGGGYDTAAAPAPVAAQPVQRAPATAQTTTDDTIAVPVFEEELVVGTQQEETGRVHLHKDVVQEQVNVPVTLRREEVTVERVPVTAQTSQADLHNAFQDQVIEVPVVGEVAIVGKRLHEIEEVRLHKDTTEVQEQVTDTVRKEHVTVDEVDTTTSAQPRPPRQG